MIGMLITGKKELSNEKSNQHSKSSAFRMRIIEFILRISLNVKLINMFQKE